MRISDWSSDVCSSDLDWSTPPSIVNSCDQLACSTLVSLPPAPRSKLVRSVRPRPSVLTSPWLKKQLWTSTTALPRFGSRGREQDRKRVGEGKSGSVRGEFGGGRRSKKKTRKKK